MFILKNYKFMTARFFRHYKNKPYTYLGTARHSETLEELVLYKTRYENAQGRVWVRPKEMFFEKIEKDGQSIFRFEPIYFNIKETIQISTENIQNLQTIAEKCFKQFDFEKLNRKLKTNSHAHLLIAFDGPTPIGFKLGFVLPDTTFDSWLGGVLPEYHGLGVASELMSKQHLWAASSKSKKIKTKAKNYFHEMIRLNLKHGFEIVGTETDANNEIQVLFEKTLNI